MLALLLAVNLAEGLLLWRLAEGGAGPSPTVVVLWAPRPDLPATLQAAARAVDVAEGAEWHDAARLLCQVLERYGAIAASGSVDEIAARLDPSQRERAAGLLRQAAAARDRIRRDQEQAGALEAEIGRLALRYPDEEPGPDPWGRLQERLEARP